MYWIIKLEKKWRGIDEVLRLRSISFIEFLFIIRGRVESFDMIVFE